MPDSGLDSTVGLTVAVAAASPGATLSKTEGAVRDRLRLCCAGCGVVAGEGPPLASDPDPGGVWAQRRLLASRTSFIGLRWAHGAGEMDLVNAGGESARLTKSGNRGGKGRSSLSPSLT